VERKRGELYLGQLLDERGERTDQALLYDASDLTTHGVIVGMTGSGKTGLGIVAIEEALLAGVPVLVIDPKGDMANLALTFPGLAGGDFQPWVNEGDAQRAGQSVEEFAAAQAAQWRSGLDRAGLGVGELRRLRPAGEVTVYTPGSDVGVALNIVGDFAPPTAGTSAESVREEAAAALASRG
jgi:DNA helicase HerA-like ATPase